MKIRSVLTVNDTYIYYMQYLVIMVHKISHILLLHTRYIVKYYR